MSTNPRYSQYGGASSPNMGTGLYTGKITLIYDDGRVRVFVNNFGRNIGPCRIVNKSAGDTISLNDEVLCTYANDTPDELIVIGRLTERIDPVSESTSGLIVEASTISELVRITQKGTGAALLVEDSTNPDSTPFIIDTSGNVGIGTLTPSTKVDISGSTAISGDLTVDTNTLKVDSTNNRVGIGTASPSVTLDVSGATSISGNLIVDTNTLVVNSTNNRVGINVTSPAFPLDVIGRADFRAAATQDGIAIVGRGGGTSSYDVTLTPTTLSADRTLTLPNVSGTAVTTGNLSDITSTGTLSSLTIDGPTSPSVFFGDWNQDNNWAGIRGTFGYLLTGSSGVGNTGMYLRTESATHPVYIGSNNTNTLRVDNTSITITGTVNATTFSGSGASLTSIPNSATTATSANTASAIVARDGSGNFTAGTITATTFSGGLASSNLTGQTGMWTSAGRPGATRLYRNDFDDAYNVQTYWTGSRWRLYGYLNNTAHADTHVGYADSAGSASTAASSSVTTFTSTIINGTTSANSSDHASMALRGGSGGAIAGMSLWATSVAPQFRVPAGVNDVYLRNANDTIYCTFYAIISNQSSVHDKQDIEAFPQIVKSASAAVNEDELLTGLNVVRQLRPVNYRWKEELHFAQLPSNPRRAMALSRLNGIRSSAGLEPFQSDELRHDCARDNCSGTAENPCPWTKNWENGNIGFIAQEVGAVVPQAANIDKKGEYSSIDNVALTAIAVAAIKELDAKVTSLMERIEALENK